MGTISEEKFEDDLKEFVERWNVLCAKLDPWHIHKNNLGTWVEQRSIVDGYTRTSSITFNSVYGVPVLWFNLYDLDGKRVLLDPESTNSTIQKLSTRHHLITENEHPCLGMAFYNLHPCHTDELIKFLSPGMNYVIK